MHVWGWEGMGRGPVCTRTSFLASRDDTSSLLNIALAATSDA